MPDEGSSLAFLSLLAVPAGEGLLCFVYRVELEVAGGVAVQMSGTDQDKEKGSSALTNEEELQSPGKIFFLKLSLV